MGAEPGWGPDVGCHVVHERLGQREESPDGLLRPAEADLDPVGLDRHARGQPGKARLERLDGHGHADPGEPGPADLGHDLLAPRFFMPEGGALAVPPELPQELGPRQRQQVPGPAGPEGRHQLRGAHLRDAEEAFDVAAGEQVLVERLELADRVRDGEQPAGLGGHGSTRPSLGGCCGWEDSRRPCSAPC